MNGKVELGDRGKDQITGFTGIVTAITHWLNSCRRVTLQPEKLDKDNKIQEARTFDGPQVTLVKRAVKKSNQKTGGPAIAPAERPNVG